MKKNCGYAYGNQADPHFKKSKTDVTIYLLYKQCQDRFKIDILADTTLKRPKEI